MSDVQVITVSNTLTEILEVSSQGPRGIPGPPGTGGGSAGAGVFIFDVTASGVVGDKVFGPEQFILSTCATDSQTVRVSFGTEGVGEQYTPVVTVQGITATLTETTTKRWFTGYADVPLVDGENVIHVLADNGANSTVTVVRHGLGPDILSIDFGPMPGAQTALKSGDMIPVRVLVPLTATHVEVLAGGAAQAQTIAVAAGWALGDLSITGLSGQQSITCKARNAFGTLGTAFTSPALDLDQVAPILSTPVVTYPGGKGALNLGDTATVACSILGFTSVSYSTPLQSIAQTYQPLKDVQNSTAGYQVSGTNYTVTAYKASNGSSASVNTLIKLATVAPTAAISVSGAPARLSSSPTGLDYEIRVTPNQSTTVAPALTANKGAWVGGWSQVGAYWKRTLRIVDSDARGAALFSDLQVTGLSNLVGNSITAGAAYTVGGLSSRNLTFPAFSRVTAIGAVVGDRLKTTATIVGGNALTRFDDALAHANGYYIADSNGNYSANGTYVGLSDSALAGANSSGTLQVTFQELP